VLFNAKHCIDKEVYFDVRDGKCRLWCATLDAATVAAVSASIDQNYKKTKMLISRRPVMNLWFPPPVFSLMADDLFAVAVWNSLPDYLTDPRLSLAHSFPA